MSIGMAVYEDIYSYNIHNFLQIQECTTGFLCIDCINICKSKGGLTLHRKKKHVDGVFSASSTEPGEPKPAITRLERTSKRKFFLRKSLRSC